jgi:hypothetical protein
MTPIRIRLNGVTTVEVHEMMDQTWLHAESGELALPGSLQAVEVVRVALTSERHWTVTFSPDRSAADPGVVELLVAFSPFLNEFGITLWKDFLLPHLQSRFGASIKEMPRLGEGASEE